MALIESVFPGYSGFSLNAPTAAAVLFGGIALWYIIPALYLTFFSPLKNVPGPLLTRFTRLWELWQVYQGNSQAAFVKLHEKYGPVVRVAPGRYSINTAAVAKTVYASGADYHKSVFYWVQGEPGNPNLFNERDKGKHSALRRKLGSLYSLSMLVNYEEAVDKMNEICERKLRQFSRQKTVVQLNQFLQFYAFDVVAKITIDKEFGMMENERDTLGIMKLLAFGLQYHAFVGLVPEIHPFLTFLMSFGTNPFLSFNGWIRDRIAEFRENKGAAKTDSKSESFAAKCLRLEEQGKITPKDTFDSVGINIGAGSDTTGITLSAAIFYIYNTPGVLQRLRDEMAAAEQTSQLSNPARFRETQELPYLQAVIKETLRLHPAVGSILPRDVPKGGVALEGYHFPAGTSIGVNAWALHRNPDVCGANPHTFDPDRWLDDRCDSNMKNAMSFAFGGGSRVCIGKHISMLEVSKVVPMIVKNFNLKMKTEGGFDNYTAWFCWPKYAVEVEEI